MLATATIEDLTLNLTQEITIHAPLEASFAALLEQMGPANETPDGNPLPMKIEPWPGGMVRRELGLPEADCLAADERYSFTTVE